MTQRYRLIQDNIVVASTEGLRAEAEIIHYARVYGQDGPVRVEQFIKRRWRRV